MKKILQPNYITLEGLKEFLDPLKTDRIKNYFLKPVGLSLQPSQLYLPLDDDIKTSVDLSWVVLPCCQGERDDLSGDEQLDFLRLPQRPTRGPTYHLQAAELLPCRYPK